VISVRGVRKAYHGRVVLDNFGLDVGEGEIVGLIGANGAGKTTAVECIQGLRHPDAGHIRVLGLDPAHDAATLRRSIGSQLQQARLPDKLRVIEAIDLFATPASTHRDELLREFGLEERRRSAFGNLSGGEQQRLFLILALLNRPRLVILDELTQGLDPAARRGVWTSIDQLRTRGTTVLLVTHELTEAEALCDRIVAMREGTVLDTGTPSDIIARHTGGVQVRFGMSGVDATEQAALRSLPGVTSVAIDNGLVTIRGDRRAVAYVGAWLVARDEPVPADLAVSTPSLEDALLTLLEPNPHGSTGGSR
jgi:ABC-2 type transport system ATP-binding protein